MTEFDALAETLLESQCWVIDLLPMRVPADSPGQYFSLADCFHTESLFQSFAAILLKLNCYRDFQVSFRDTWIKNPAGADLCAWVSKCRSTQERLIVLLPFEETLITLDGDDNHMTLFHPTEELLDLVRQLAAAEGLFVWEGIS